MERQGKLGADVAARLLVPGPAFLPHHDLWVQLETIEPRDRHDLGLWPRIA
jgi:hypothetical protein